MLSGTRVMNLGKILSRKNIFGSVEKIYIYFNDKKEGLYLFQLLMVYIYTINKMYILNRAQQLAHHVSPLNKEKLKGIE